MIRVFTLLLIVCSGFSVLAKTESYFIGSGIYDITGPAAEMEMMGYVSPKQKTEGISTRLYSRAFVILDPQTDHRVVLVSIDECHVYESVTAKVVEKLQEKFGSLYNEKNLLIQSTHTHSAPGGLSYYKLYNLSSLGFSQQNFEIVTEGIYQSIVRAHENLAPGNIGFNRGVLDGISINRSPEAYLLNPAEERAEYSHDLDKDMTVLSFKKQNGKEIGAINWFAVHATSVKVANRLISSDNKGYASWLMEKQKGARYVEKEPFIASFPNTNAGDASPNISKDLDGDRVWDCPLLDSFKCSAWSGRKQAEKAMELYEGTKELLSGPVEFRHLFVDMSAVQVTPEFTRGEPAQTCFGAMGLSMLAGTKDGAGIGREGQTCSNPSRLGKILCRRFPCHGEKPVAISIGIKQPIPWSPPIVPVQIIRIGQLVLIGMPGEFTTMSGRRMRKTILNVLEKVGVKYAVLAGYANGYAGYIATKEEYQYQNYEGAATHFGEWTLAAYQQIAKSLAENMAEEIDTPAGPRPLELSGVDRRLVPKDPNFDKFPIGKTAGMIEIDVAASYRKGEVVQLGYWGGYPNNNMQTQSSFLEIQKSNGINWQTVAYDRDPETKFIWAQKGRKKNFLTIEWEIPLETLSGEYRILYRGDVKTRAGELIPYEGFSRVFTVLD